MISFEDVSIRRGKKLLLSGASLQIHPGFKVGLTGKNGTGKSTLFSVFMGGLSVDAGELSRPDNWVVAHMAQEVTATDMTALDFVLSGDAEWFSINTKLQNQDALADDEIASLHEQFDSIDGFTAESRASQMLNGLGFKEQDHTNPVSSFSGGWQMRLNLAKTLMCRSDLLLLDEPTNHLDLDAILWLEDWLSSYAGTLLLISHDQQFLDVVITHIVNIEHQTATLYTGNYAQFQRVRAERLAQHEQAIAKQEATRAHLQAYIDRFRAKATKAKQAQSRIKQLERMQSLSPILAEHEFSFSFFEPTHMNSPLINMNKLAVGYPDLNGADATIIIDKVTMQITPDSRIGLLGANGAGKSTLIKTIVQELEKITGEIKYSESLKIGYFSQHKVDALDADSTPFLIFRRLIAEEKANGGKDVSDAQIRSHLGGFGFQGERIDTNVEVFSGGERARLNLAMIVWLRPNLLILDEPTNHLDIQMKQALTFAIQNFKGALLLVSHDRELITAVCDELYLVHDGKCDSFDGDIADYSTWIKQQKKLAKELAKNNTNTKDTVGDSRETTVADTTQIQTQDKHSHLSKEEKRKLLAKQREATAPLRKQIQQIEKDLGKVSDKLTTIEEQLADSSIYEDANKDKLKDLLQKQVDYKARLESFEETMLMSMEELEELENTFDM